MKQNPKSDFKRCAMLKQGRCPTSKQRFTTAFQRCFNVDTTLSQNCFNVASTLVKAKTKPVWLVISMGLQKD